MLTPVSVVIQYCQIDYRAPYCTNAVIRRKLEIRENRVSVWHRVVAIRNEDAIMRSGMIMRENMNNLEFGSWSTFQGNLVAVLIVFFGIRNSAAFRVQIHFPAFQRNRLAKLKLLKEQFKNSEPYEYLAIDHLNLARGFRFMEWIM